MGIIIGGLAGGIGFFVFGLTRAVYVGGVSMVIIISRLKGSPVEQSPFVRIMVAAGIIACALLGLAVAVVLGGVIGGVIEYALIKIA